MAAAAGIVQNFEFHESASIGGDTFMGGGRFLCIFYGIRLGNSTVNAGLDQGLREHRLGVVAGGGFAGVAGAFEEDVAFFNAHLTQRLETFFFANKGLVVGVKVGLYRFAFGGGAFILQVDRRLGGALKAELQQTFVDAAQVGDAHVFEVAFGVKQGVAPVGFIEQLFQQLAQGGVVEYLGGEQEQCARRVKQAAVEEGDVNVLRTFVEHFKQLLERIHAIVQAFTVGMLPTQGLENVVQTEALVKRVCF